ncbi:MAG: glycosyltransferase [Euzebya sp.]
MTPAVSVCIVTRGRHQLPGRCLDALAAQKDPPTFEIVVATDDDPGAGSVVLDRFPGATVVDMCHLTPGGARNLLVDRASGGLLLFLDDDVEVPPGMVRDLWRVACQHPDVDVFGGPNLSPPQSTVLQWSQGEALASRIGGGPLRHRFTPGRSGETDERRLMLCNLAVRRSAFRPFPDDLVTAEENAVLAEMTAAGVRMRVDPSLGVVHVRRPSYGAFFQQVRGWGVGRGRLARRSPGTVRPHHLIPTVFVLYLVAGTAASPFIGLQAVLPLAAYVGLVTGWSLARPHRGVARATCVVLLHMGYGIGVLTGLFRPPSHAEWSGRPQRAQLG